MDGDNILQARDIFSGYGKIEILHGVSLTVRKGSITGVIGPNGSGKSTLLKAIFGLIPIWKGYVEFNNEDITNTKPNVKIMKGISYLAQRRSIFPFLSVEENLKMGVWIFRHKEEAVKESLNIVYNKFPILKERKNVAAGALSGGEQRMLELGRSLMTNPKFVILDEFSAGLAPKITAELYEHLTTLKNDEGISILGVEQNVDLISSLADYIYVLKLGRNSGEGPGHEIKEKINEVIADWLRV